MRRLRPWTSYSAVISIEATQWGIERLISFAGFRGLDLLSLAITTNARGGPGIVLASVAFDAGIISPQFYTTLVIAAVLTSQMAGAWLDYILRKGWPLLAPLPSDKLVTARPLASEVV